MLPLVSHGEYADGTDRQTDGRQTVTLRFPLDLASVINEEETMGLPAGSVQSYASSCTHYVVIYYTMYKNNSVFI